MNGQGTGDDFGMGPPDEHLREVLERELGEVPPESPSEPAEPLEPELEPEPIEPSEADEGADEGSAELDDANEDDTP
jgi:hypothetical protein